MNEGKNYNHEKIRPIKPKHTISAWEIRAWHEQISAVVKLYVELWSAWLHFTNKNPNETIWLLVLITDTI